VKVYVASKSSSARLALLEGNIIEVCESGMYPRQDAESYAKDYVRDTDQAAWVYEVELKATIGFKIYKEVTSIVPPKS
jgi:hypothetical protein